MTPAKHPAKFSDPILVLLEVLVIGRRLILDPFAGTGRVHDLGVPSVGVEIEPEWATLHPKTLVGNALDLPFRSNSFDAIVTSPTYGNRMADHHVAKDSSKRNTYRHTLGRALHPENSGRLQWGHTYRAFHRNAWAEAIRVLAPDGGFICNVSDHIRKGEVQLVTDFHVTTLTRLGLQLERTVELPTRRQKQGANRDARVPFESVLIFRKE